MTVKELKEALEGLGDDQRVMLTWDGEIDAYPTYIVEDGVIFIEGGR